MPTETFFKLPEEKKNRIVEASIKEFTRVPIEEVSIKNIVEEAGIARGSFYQYFRSKSDLLDFILKKDFDLMEDFIIQSLEKNNGDIFQVFIELFDYVVEEIFTKENIEFHKKFFENLKTKDNMFAHFSCINMNEECIDEMKSIFERKKVVEKIDVANLKIEDEKDLKVVLNMLVSIMKKSIITSFQYTSFKEGKNEYIKMIEILKYGALKS